jgi:hypothetical protein
MPLLRHLSEGLARHTSRRGLFGRTAGALFVTLAGAAGGTLVSRQTAVAATSCQFPGPPCQCAKCRVNGTCAKPCVILTQFYASGCWVSFEGATCCDCDCQGVNGYHWCGCGTDYHDDVRNCPQGTAP